MPEPRTVLCEIDLWVDEDGNCVVSPTDLNNIAELWTDEIGIEPPCRHVQLSIRVELPANDTHCLTVPIGDSGKELTVNVATLPA